MENKPRFYCVFHTKKDGTRLLSGNILTKEQAEKFGEACLYLMDSKIFIVQEQCLFEFLKPYRLKKETDMLSKYDDEGRFIGGTP